MVRDTKLYDVLGVAPSADADAVKKAYRKAALRWHPDRNHGAGKEAAEAKFKEAQRAYDVLSDAGARGVYDAYGEDGLAARDAGAPPPPQQQGGAHFFRAPAGAGGGFGGRTFRFSGGGGGLDANVLEQLLGGMGAGGMGGWAPGGAPAGSFASFAMPTGGAGGDPFAMPGGGAGGDPWVRGSAGSRPRGFATPRAAGPGERDAMDEDLPAPDAGPFVAGRLVRAVGLAAAPELNGRRGTAVRAAAGGRVVVDFGGAEKALRPANLRAAEPAALAPGAVVAADGLTGATALNGQRGVVVGAAAGGERVEVRFSAGAGVKALLPGNLRPL